MLFDKKAVQENIRNKDGKRVFYLGKGHQLTSDARDWLTGERIPILSAEQARQNTYRLQNGAMLERKPEHMTHLNAEVLVDKTHPRIAFRGAMDTLEAELMLCQLNLQEPWKNQVEEALNFSRELIRCDVLEEPVSRRTLCGMTESELRSHSHRPQDYYGQAHFMPSVTDGAAVLWLNRARCAARAAELAAVRAFGDREGNPTRVDILQALNRMSSMLYILMIQVKAQNGKL